MASAETASATIIMDLSANASLADGSFSVDGTTNGQVDFIAMSNMGAMGTTIWDLALEATPGAMMAPGSTLELYTTAAGMDNDLVLMTTGQTVDGSLAYAGDAMLMDGGVPSAGWVAGSTGYAGFTFDDGGTTVFGWLQIELGASFDDFTVLQWAYEDSGAPIAVAMIPEPSTAILLGLGLVGLTALVRKRPRPPSIDAAS
jgi:hypothetical protein